MYKSSFNLTVHGLPYNHAPTATVTSDTTEIPYTYEVTVVDDFSDPSGPGDYQMTIQVKQVMDENNLENNSGNNVSATAWGPFTVTVSSSGYNSVIITGTEITTEITMEAYIIRLYDDKTDTGYVIKDQNAVCLTGNQTVDGQKTFTSNIYQQLVNPNYVAKHTGLEKGTTPSSTGSLFMGLYDKNGGSTGRLAGYLGEYNTAGYVRSSLLAYTPTSGVTSYSYLSMITNTSDCYARIINASGITNKSISKVSSSTADDYIPTMGWVNNPACSTGIVHRTGDETIAGDKTFSGTITAGSGIGIKFNTGDGTNYYQVRSSGSPSTGLSFLLNNSTSYNALNMTSTTITIGSANITPLSVTPATSDNSTKIATTAYVKNQGYALDSDVVKTSGNQSVAGTKTFSNAPVVANNNPVYILKDTNLTKGTAPSSNNDMLYRFRDNDDVSVGNVFLRVDTSNNSILRCEAAKMSASSSATAYSQVKYNANGEYYLQFTGANQDTGDANISLTKSTTSTTDTTIPCMGWVNSKLENVIGDWGTATEITTLTSSNTYTLPNSGYISPLIQIKYHEYINILVNNVAVWSFEDVGGDASDNFKIRFAPIQVKKGDVIKFTTTASGTSTVVNLRYWGYR